MRLNASLGLARNSVRCPAVIGSTAPEPVNKFNGDQQLNNGFVVSGQPATRESNTESNSAIRREEYLKKDTNDSGTLDCLADIQSDAATKPLLPASRHWRPPDDAGR